MRNDLRLNISRVRWDSTWVKTGKFSGYWSFTRTDERNYYVKDHLGSIRITLDETGNVVSGQDYFAFGEIMRSYNNASVNDKYKFTEKERDTETNYDYFGARYYDSEIGRWLQVDPLGEIQQGWTPYHYAYNNPLKFTDPTGMIPKFDTAEELYDWLWARDIGDSGGGDESEGNDDDAPTTGDPSIDYILGQLFGLYKQTAANTETAVKNLPQNIVERTRDAADFVSDGSSYVAFAGIILIPITGGSSISLTGHALSVGMYADFTSTVAKGIDYWLYNGSRKEFLGQATKTGLTYLGGKLLDLTAAKFVVRTGQSNILFRNNGTGKYINHNFGFTVEAVRDATKISIGLGL